MNMTTTEAVAIFEKALLGSNYSPRTIRAYTDDVKQYLAFVQKGRVDWDIPSRLDRTGIVEFINHLAALKTTGVTRFRKLASLRKFFRFLQENGIIYGCPTDTIKPTFPGCRGFAKHPAQDRDLVCDFSQTGCPRLAEVPRPRTASGP